MNAPDRTIILDELVEHDAREEKAKQARLSAGERLLKRIDRLSNPTPAQKRLAWFDNRKSKAKRIVRELRAAGIDASVADEDPKP